MQYILLGLVILFMTSQDVVKKIYSKREEQKTFLFMSVASLVTVMFFIITSGFKLEFNWNVVIYSVCFAISCSTSLIGSFLAIKWGPMSISMLVTSYSLVVPTLYGIVILNEKMSLFGIIGAILLMISLFLIADKTQMSKLSFRWFVALLMSFFGNGLCSTVQKVQQLDFDGGYKSEFMIIAFIICAVVLFVASCINKEGVKGIGGCILPGAIVGIAVGAVNLMVMILTGIIPNSILFPSVSAGGVVLGYIVATFVYKESLSKMQTIGYIIGTISVVLLNL